jgi:hypothetical protein
MEDTSTIRSVVAVTSNPSLVIGLTFLGRDWDVASQAGIDDLPDADALVIDVGASSAAVEVLRALAGPRPPAVVIGDVQLDVAEGDRLLLRPYTLDALADEIDAALGRSGVSDSVGAGEGIEAEEAPQADHTSPTDPAPQAERTGRPARSERPDRPKGRRARHGPSGQDPPRQDAASGPDLVIELPTASETDVGPTRLPSTEPPTVADPGVGSDAPAEDDRVLRVPESAPQDPIRDRLTAALATGSELERLVTDVPMIRSLRGLARAVVAEAREALGADTVGFWQRTDAGFRVIAAIGLTTLETKRLVELDQPMMAEVDATGGGLLIDPVEYAQAAVTGIGGAHTGSFMVASIAMGSERFGLIAVGRNEPLTPADLDRLIDLASEAAPGVGVAQLLERLGRLPGVEPAELALAAPSPADSRG